MYVATIHTGHMATALQMIAAGKHVLVEKPMCMNAGEVERLVAAATEKVRHAVHAVLCVDARCLTLTGCVGSCRAIWGSKV